MDYSEIVRQFSEKVDSVTYIDKKDSMEVDDAATLDWSNIVPEPPRNASLTTRKELEYLSELTANTSTEEKRLVTIADKEALDLFSPIANRFGIEIPSKLIKNLFAKIFWPITYNLKFKFNRPRPEQLAPFYGININVIKTTTHQTPAYPSGHTTYGFTIAHVLSDMYPLHRDEFFSQAKLVALARCLQGVHYPSDNEASMMLVKAVWENVKNNTFTGLEVLDKERSV